MPTSDFSRNIWS